MENYIVINSFYKLSDQKNYNVGDVIELSKEDGERMVNNNLVEKVKTPKTKK